MDGWLRAHIASDTPAHVPYTMGYYIGEDLSVPLGTRPGVHPARQLPLFGAGPTDPNRAFWMNGTNDPQGTGGGPILETVMPPPLTFESGAETMFNAEISLWLYNAGKWRDRRNRLAVVRKSDEPRHGAAGPVQRGCEHGHPLW